MKSRLEKCNMLKRKIETVLQDWKKNPSRKPLVIKLGKYNVGRDGETLTLPLYMSFLLTAY